MITESSEWRNELARDLRNLRRRLKKTASSRRSDVWSRTGAQVEKFTFTAGFIARKLMDSNKLSDDVEHAPVPVLKHDPIDSGSSFDCMFTRYHFWEYYDMERSAKWSLSGRDLCNVLVHSLVFDASTDTEEATQFNTVFFNSDRTKDALFEISLEAFFKFIEDVIDDDIETMSWNRRTGEIKKTRRPGPPVYDSLVRDP